MPNSKLTINSVDYEFEGDDRYDLGWELWQNQAAQPLQGGKAIVSAAKISLATYTISGKILTTISKSADTQLHELVEACIDNIDTDTTAVCTLVVGQGNIVLTGWPVNILAPRDAVDGEEVIPITFEFILSEKANYSGLSI